MSRTHEELIAAGYDGVRPSVLQDQFCFLPACQECGHFPSQGHALMCSKKDQDTNQVPTTPESCVMEFNNELWDSTAAYDAICATMKPHVATPGGGIRVMGALIGAMGEIVRHAPEDMQVAFKAQVLKMFNAARAVTAEPLVSEEKHI